MKTKYFLLFLGLIGCLTACEVDNYSKPDALFTGQVLYKGDTIRVGANEVYFQLFQPSYELNGPFNVNLDLDGSFSGRLFSGDYKLILVKGQGPFKASPINQEGDTLSISLHGDTHMDLEVTPYYMIRNPEISKSGNDIEASIKLEKILTGQEGTDVEYVRLFLNQTKIVSNSDDYNIAQADGDFSNLNAINLSTNIPDDYGKPYIFARVGVKMVGVEDLIFSPVKKIAL